MEALKTLNSPPVVSFDSWICCKTPILKPHSCRGSRNCIVQLQVGVRECHELRQSITFFLKGAGFEGIGLRAVSALSRTSYFRVGLGGSSPVVPSPKGFSPPKGFSFGALLCMVSGLVTR